MSLHRELLFSFFDELIQNIDNECEAISQIRKIGQDHAKLNHSCSFNAEIWERLGEIAMQTLSSLDAVQVSKGLHIHNQVSTLLEHLNHNRGK